MREGAREVEERRGYTVGEGILIYCSWQTTCFLNSNVAGSLSGRGRSRILKKGGGGGGGITKKY